MAVVYFTSNASTGAGSLSEAVRNAAPGDVVRPDESVFGRGSTIEIVLASTLNVDKNLTLDASPFRVRVDGGGAVACASVANGCVAIFTAFDFVDGVASQNAGNGGIGGNGGGNGGGLRVENGANVVLNRCRVCGCDAAQNGGGVCVDDGASFELNDGVITGCRANVGGGVYLGATAGFTSQGSTLAGNVDAASNGGSGGCSDVVAAVGFDATSQTPINSIICAAISDSGTLYDATTAAENGSVVGVPASELGFVAPPDPAASFESWSRNAWRNLDLRLLDDASPNPSIYRDSGAVDKMSRYDLDGNFRGRETNGATTCSPGAYETLQADLFWVGVEIDPTAPGDLTASDYDASARTLTLSWTPNLDDVTGYDVQTSTNGGETWSNLADMSADATSRPCGGLSAGKTYGYRVRAYNASGPTAWSTIIFTPNALDEATVEIGTRAVVSPSMFTPNGWAASRFSQRPGDAAPAANQTLFVDGSAAFVDTAPQNARLNVGGRATVSISSDGSTATTRLVLTLGVGATFGLSASATAATLRRFGEDAKLNWTSGDLTVVVDVASSALTVPPGATLTVAGVRVAVETLRIGDAASIVLSPAGSQDANDGTGGTATTCVDAILTATESATVGAASFTGVGYFATPQGTDATAATFETSVRRVDYCAEVKAFAATATGPTSAKIEWNATNETARVCVERENAAAPNGWEMIAVATAEASPMEVALSGSERFRIFDGATFRVDSAWFPTGDFYVYVADSSVSALAAERSEWAAITQTIKAGGAMGYRNENVMFMAQVKNRLSGGWLAPSDVVGITATVCRVYANGFAPDEWVPVDGWEGVAVPTACVLEAPTANDAWTADAEGPNFVWVPDVRERAFFPTGGKFATQLRFDLTDGRNPIYLTFVDEVD